MINLELLKKRKKKKGLSYRALSKQLGFKGSGTVHKWFSGKTEIKARYVHALAAILDMSFEEILTTPQPLEDEYEGGGR